MNEIESTGSGSARRSQGGIQLRRRAVAAALLFLAFGSIAAILALSFVAIHAEVGQARLTYGAHEVLLHSTTALLRFEDFRGGRTAATAGMEEVRRELREARSAAEALIDDGPIERFAIRGDDAPRMQERLERVRSLVYAFSIALERELDGTGRGLRVPDADGDYHEIWERLAREVDGIEGIVKPRIVSSWTRVQWAQTILGGILLLLFAGTVHLFRVREIEREATIRANEQARLAAEENERRVRATMESLNDAVITTDPAGRVTFLNSAAVRLTGWTDLEARGRLADELVPLLDEETSVPVAGPFARVAALRTPFGRLSALRLRRRDGSTLPIVVSVSPIHGAAGETIGLVGSLTDVSSEAAMREELERARQMEFLGRLTAGLAHEVRNPLHAIESLAAALATDLGDDPENRAILAAVRGQIDRLSRLMTDLLAIGKPIQPSTFRTLDPAALCRETADLWHPPEEVGLRIVRIVDEGDHSIQVLGNSSKLQQVLVNLLDNAAHFCAPDQPIRVEIRRAVGQVTIRIVDLGAGIPPQHLDRLFLPFFTLRKGGTGLGLSLVRHIVEAHGGSIGLRNNEPPPGCTAEITLPAIPPPLAAATTDWLPPPGRVTA